MTWKRIVPLAVYMAELTIMIFGEGAKDRNTETISGLAH
jgi:hypothetical protein